MYTIGKNHFKKLNTSPRAGCRPFWPIGCRGKRDAKLYREECDFENVS